jgi:hypothetical protein
MIPQTAAPPPGTGGVQREIDCSSGFANSTLPFLRQCLTFRLPCRGWGVDCRLCQGYNVSVMAPCARW